MKGAPSPTRCGLALAAVSALALAPTVAHASPHARDELAAPQVPSSSSSNDTLTLDLDVMTYAPIAFGGGIEFEVPGHIVFRLFGGTVPDFYVNAVNDVADQYGLYGATTAQLVDDLTRGAIILEAGAGIRPMGSQGLELYAGYLLFWNTPTVDGGQLGLPSDMGMDRVQLAISIYAIHGELAFNVDLFDAINLRVGLGWIHTVSTAIGFHVDQETRDAADGAVEQREAAVASDIGRYGSGPVLDVAMGFRL